MNFLAHLYLSDATPASAVGNLMPDLVRGRLPSGLPAEVAAGVARHRAVDAFTDTHPVFLTSRARLREPCGLFSGVLADLFYDHALASCWTRHHDEPLGAFVAERYALLQAGRELMPPRMATVVDRMIGQDWLNSYAQVEGVAARMTQMAQRFELRFGRTFDVRRAVEVLEARRERFFAEFDVFFPELIGAIGVGPAVSRSA